MKSKANIKSHPIHAILVAFPITLFIGTAIFDILLLITDNESFRMTASYLNIGGIAFGLLAAVPGIIDYRYTVPPDSSAKKRATKHGLINTLVIILFGVALIVRQNEPVNHTPIVIIELIAVALLTVAGWLGGTLVYRNQIGVDIRYAGAGKWKEEYIDTAEMIIPVAKADELRLNQMKLIHINGRRIVLGRTELGFTAFDDRCTHRGGSLAGGTLICGTVQCPWHGSQFNVTSGSVLYGPAENPVKTYKVSVKEAKVFLEWPASFESSSTH
jgi:uncharacterized membrane protein/nitrite reductase/ring-hydroxylating ferredoxin subunit